MEEILNEPKVKIPVQILFVDDDENILRSLKRLVIDEDLGVITANSGEKALEILKENDNIGVIISDQRMPEMKGVDFLEKAKEIKPDSLRILLTGYSDINAAIDSINRGGTYRYITKPWNDEELLQIIREAVQRYSLIKEIKRLYEIIKKQNKELKLWNDQLQYFVQEQTIEIQNNNKELQVLNKKLKDNLKNTIIVFSGLLELRDKRIMSHSKYVSEISVKVAKSMNLSDEEIESIAVASLLHDIGKIGIPDIIFLKDTDSLSPEEKKEYMMHPVRGQSAIDLIEDLRNAGVLIRHHHEWYNGAGFPDKLKKDKIPLGSRIIAIADFVDRTIRKFQSDNAIELTLSKLKEELWIRFDPELYDLIEPSVKEVYSNFLPQTGIKEIELYPKDLKVGMVLSRDVRTGTGVLLLSKGIELNEANIENLNRYYKLDPSKNGVFVWVKS